MNRPNGRWECRRERCNPAPTSKNDHAGGLGGPGPKHHDPAAMRREENMDVKTHPVLEAAKNRTLIDNATYL